MSFARPQSLAGVHPDTIRIVAMSAAIALNAAALLAVMRPMAATLSLAPPASPTIRLIDHPAEPPVVPPPPILLKPLPPKVQAQSTRVPKPVEVVPQHVQTPSDEGRVPVTVTTPINIAPTSSTPESAAPAEERLAYVSAPAPAYPRAAIGARMQGTVTLRVLVDETGKPIDVVVENTSGHELLDKAARDQVLARWRFQPATANGHAVKAWARVPVTFDLRHT